MHLVVSNSVLALSFQFPRDTHLFVFAWAALWIAASMVWLTIEQRHGVLLRQFKPPVVLSIINHGFTCFITPSLAMLMTLLYSPVRVMGPMVVFFLVSIISPTLVRRRLRADEPATCGQIDADGSAKDRN